MQYRTDKYGNQISALGFGCMRFPRKGGKIDMQETEREILHAIEAGVNYFDTAYIYPGSEAALGEILQKNGLRDKVNIATKLPHYLIRSRDALDKYFDEHLARLRTDHVDYYLMHMMNDTGTWEKLKAMGIEEWLEQKKASGAIRQIGFSYHGNSDMFCKVVDAYDWDFAQIQYNYMDEHSQAGRKGLNYANSKGLAVIIMEPLRGGKLVNNLPSEAQKLFAATPYTPAQWGLRWLWDQSEVTCVLSGMNSMEMLDDNIHTACTTQVGQLTADDKAMLNTVLSSIRSGMKVGCTGCGYCTPCPKGVDIPGVFAAYNTLGTEGKIRAKRDYLMNTAMRKTNSAASNCIGCGKCEAHCPQSIPIRQELKNAARQLEGPAYAVARRFIKWLRIY